MRKTLLQLTLAGALLLSVPTLAGAATAVEIIDNDIQPVGIGVQESTVRITGASGETLYVYNVAGVRVKSIKIDGDDKRFDLNLPKGCYILKVGKTVKKISIR